MLVDPTLARQTGGRKLARRERDLAVNPVNPIAVVINVLEVVISADLLELGKGGQQRLVVPHADVAESRLILSDVIQAQVFDGGEFALFEAIQRIRLAGEFDGVCDVGAFPINFIGGHNEALDDLGVNRSADQGYDQEQSQGVKRWPHAPQLRAGHKGHGCQQAKEEFHPENRQRGVHVRVPSAINEAARGIKQAIHGKPGSIGEDHKEHRRQHHQVRARRPHHFWPTRRNPYPALHEIEEHGAQNTHNHRSEREVIKEPDEGQAKEIKAQIDAKQRVLLAEDLRVLSHQILKPVGHAPLADQVSNQQDASPDEPLDSYAEAVERRKLDDSTVNPKAVPAGEPAGNQEVQCSHRHEPHSDQSAQSNLG